MKIITIQQLENTIDAIVYDREEVSKLKRETFIGVSREEMISELERKLGNNWLLKKNHPVKLSQDDIVAVANNRFFRKTGTKLLMAWAIVILAFAILTLTFRLLPLQVYYGLSGIVTGCFLFIYSKKQRKVRDELNQAAYGSDKVETDR